MDITPKGKKKAAIYIRVSTEEQAEKFGAQAQLEKINQYLKLKEDEVEFVKIEGDSEGEAKIGDEFVFDEIKSGATDMLARPQFINIMEHIFSDDCPFDTIIVYKLDRLARKLLILLNIVETLKENNIGFISTQESIDTNSIMGQAMIGFLGIFAQIERDTIKERTLGGRNVSRKKKGIRGLAPYGYTKSTEDRLIYINKDTAKMVKLIFDLYTKNSLSVLQITKKLRNDKVLTPAMSSKHHSSEWMKDPYFRRVSAVKKILRDKTYIGEYWFSNTNKNGERIRELSEVRNEAIISEEQFLVAEKMLEKKLGYTKKNTKYILSGLLKCDCCKEEKKSMIARIGNRSGNNLYYQCGAKNTTKNFVPCGAIPLQKEALEKLIISKVKEFILNPDRIKIIAENNKKTKKKGTYIRSQVNNIKKKIKINKNSLEKIRKLYIYDDNNMTEDEYNEERGIIIENIESLEATLVNALNEEQSSKKVEKYQKVFNYISSLTKNDIDKIFSDKEKARSLLSYVIDEIIVYSRPVTAKDKIQGRKKSNGTIQMVPYHIDIKFKLPNVILKDMLESELNEDDDEDTTITSAKGGKTQEKGNNNSNIRAKNDINIVSDSASFYKTFGITKKDIFSELYNIKDFYGGYNYKKVSTTILTLYSMIKCPHCNNTLTKNQKQYTCSNNHSFDISKEGYINLLLGNRKNSGDDSMMIKARRNFLETGMYTPFSQEINRLVDVYSGDKDIVIGDFGCGEGRYIRQLQQYRQSSGHNNDCYFGVDISKEAVKYCAKHTQGTFVVGNTNTVPFEDNSCDFILSIFSPYKEKEIQRCLKKDGKAIIVGPGPDHLYDFIEMIWDKPHKHIIKDPSEKYTTLTLVETNTITNPLHIENNQTIKDLFMMTPYYRKAPKKKQDAIMRLSSLQTKAQFIIDLVH